jgi:hypothetical protein
VYPSDWVLVAADRATLDRPQVTEVARPLEARRGDRAWTDDFNNLVRAMK